MVGNSMSARPREAKQALVGVGAGAATGALLLTLLVGTGAARAATAGFSAGVDGSTLNVQGGPVAERIALRLSANASQLLVDVGDDGSAERAFDLASFGAIAVDAGNGDDVVLIDQANGAFTTTKPTSIAGGNGNDTLLGGSGAETFVGGRGDDVADGNGGADTAFMGKGDDTFIWDPGDGSDRFEGGAGSDTMVFNGAAGTDVMAANANGSRIRFTRVQGTIVMDLDDVEAIDVRALAGTDAITVGDVGGTDLRRVDVDLATSLTDARSDGAADTITILGTDGVDTIRASALGDATEVSGLAATVHVLHADPELDSLVLDSGEGADDVSVDNAVEDLLLVSVK
jgi:hemolysin type calcium-binding protein